MQLLYIANLVCCNVFGKHSAVYQNTPTSMVGCSFTGRELRLICMIPPAHMGRGVVIHIWTNEVHVEDSSELQI